MRTDTIFYQLFQTFPNLLFELIGENPDQARQLVQTARQEVANVAFKEKVIELIETVLIYKLPKLNLS